MSAALTRGMAILDRLAGESDGLSLTEIASALSIPPSATHRLLADLVADGYVRQDKTTDQYSLTLRFVSLGLRQLAVNDLAMLARATLERLADVSGELVRLSLVEGDELVWVARVQGARSGLRYDPDHGRTVRLSCSASGHAWLAGLPEEDALALLYRQGIGRRDQYGPQAPETADDVRACLNRARNAGYATVSDSFEAGTSAMAAPVFDRDGRTVGVLSIAGPSIRLNADKMSTLVSDLLAGADELSGLELRHATTGTPMADHERSVTAVS